MSERYDRSALPRVGSGGVAFPGVELNVPFDALENQEIVIEAYDLREGKFGPWAVILCSGLDGSTEQFTTSTGAAVVLRKLAAARVESRLPGLATVVKPGRYYDLI